jgi:aspartate-semialdehyde dehydrogenase
MKIAIIGSTGLVGREILKVLDEFQVNFDEIYFAASEKSVGKIIDFRNQQYSIKSIHEVLNLKPNISIFSAGSSVSLEYAPKFKNIGCYVVDNSSAWRMNEDIPLVVPEINFDIIRKDDYIIANPNCSTIQLVMVIYPIYHRYGLKRMVVSTYQAVTGTGKEAVEQLFGERSNDPNTKKVYPYPIDLNCIPQCDVFLENDYTKEEMKIINETRKILGNQHLKITSTAVRVPVIGGHSESVNLELEKSFSVADIKEILYQTPGVVVMDNPSEKEYPMPILAHKKNEVFVGRIRRDESIENGLNLWIVADNLRKGAATNAVQIAVRIQEKFF